MEKECQKSPEESWENQPSPNGVGRTSGDEDLAELPPPLPKGYSALGVPRPRLRAFNDLWGVSAQNSFLEEAGYLVYDIERAHLFLVADEVVALFDQLAQELPHLLPFCLRVSGGTHPEIVVRVNQALASYERAQFPLVGVETDQALEDREQLYVFLSCEARASARVADLIESFVAEQGIQAQVLLYGISSKESNGFVLVHIRGGNQPFLQWLRETGDISDFVAFPLK